MKFCFLILPELHILDLAGADQAILEAKGYNADFEILYCGNGEKVTTSGGLPFGDVAPFSQVNLQKSDYLIIPGAAFSYLTSKEFIENRDLFEWINMQYHKGVHLCSICLGAFVLAECGLLDGKNCTTHFKKIKELQQRYPKAKVQENILYTDEDGIYTSAGIASGIDLMLHIIEKLEGSYFAHLIARELVVYNRRQGNAAQEGELMMYRNHIHSGVHTVQDYIINHISQKTYLYKLAEMACMSERNLTRIFRRETGVSVHDFITKIRIAKAKEWLKNPDLSMIDIANRVGLQSEKQLNRILHEN
jgi:transcriptional regulator GlxA family with amidase domain